MVSLNLADEIARGHHCGHNSSMSDIAGLKSAFLSAAYGKLSPHLMKYTAQMEGDKVTARIVVLDAIGEDELDTIYEILGDAMGHTGGTAMFDLIRVASVSQAEVDAELPINLFRAYSLNYQS